MLIVIAILVILAIIAGIHLYLWKRLVRDTLAGRARRLGGFGVIGLAVLIPLALVGERLVPQAWRPLPRLAGVRVARAHVLPAGHPRDPGDTAAA